MSRDRMQKGLAVLLLVAVLVADALAVYHLFVRWQGTRFDFYPRWVGARAMLFEGLNPYSPEVTLRSQMGYYGRPAQPGESPHDFLYPAFIAFTIPHFLLPFPAAITIWLVTLQVLLILTVAMVAGCLGRSLRPWQFAVATLVVVAFRYDVLAMGLGQFTIYVMFSLGLTWWLWRKGHDFWAGCALTQALLKPQLTFLILPLWLGLALVQRRWRFLAGFGACLAVLIVLPMPFAGNWLVGFLNPPARYERAAGTELLSAQIAQALRFGLSAALWPLAAWVWARAAGLQIRRWAIWRRAPPAFPTVGYALMQTIAIVLVTTPRLRGYDLATAALPLCFLILAQYQRGPAAIAFQAGAWIVLLVLPWALSVQLPLPQVESVERLIVGPVVLGLTLAFPIFRRRAVDIEGVG